MGWLLLRHSHPPPSCPLPLPPGKLGYSNLDIQIKMTHEIRTDFRILFTQPAKKSGNTLREVSANNNYFNELARHTMIISQIVQW